MDMLKQLNLLCRALGYGSYKQYLRSLHWLDFRKEYFENHEEICHCGETKNLHLHHLTYVRLGAERFQDVIPLCPPCHAQEHKLLQEQGKFIPLPKLERLTGKKQRYEDKRTVKCIACSRQRVVHKKRFKTEMQVYKRHHLKWHCEHCCPIDNMRGKCASIRQRLRYERRYPNGITVMCSECGDDLYVNCKNYEIEKSAFEKEALQWECLACRSERMVIEIKKACKSYRHRLRRAKRIEIREKQATERKIYELESAERRLDRLMINGKG